MLLLHNSAPAGLALDRRLRKRLHAASVAELGFALDYSAGMAVLQPGEADLAELMARADGALYAAKTTGRLAGGGWSRLTEATSPVLIASSAISTSACGIFWQKSRPRHHGHARRTQSLHDRTF